jgi:hypothetical protein
MSTAILPTLASPSFQGVVLAVYRTALSIAVTDSGGPATDDVFEPANGFDGLDAPGAFDAPGGRLLTIARWSAGGLPDGISVDNGFEPGRLELVAGMPVAPAGAACLSVADRLHIVLQGAAGWSPVMVQMHAASPGLRARATVLHDAVAALRRGSGAAFGTAQETTAVDALGPALRAGDTAAARLGCELIGLGRGLTPSGDDVLVGLSAALAATGVRWGRSLAGQWARHAAGRTTRVAEGYHRHAAAGEFAGRLHDLLFAVLVGPVEGIPAAVARVAALGATSGLDTLVGVDLGLNAAAAAAPEQRVA